MMLPASTPDSRMEPGFHPLLVRRGAAGKPRVVSRSRNPVASSAEASGPRVRQIGATSVTGGILLSADDGAAAPGAGSTITSASAGFVALAATVPCRFLSDNRTSGSTPDGSGLDCGTGGTGAGSVCIHAKYATLAASNRYTRYFKRPSPLQLPPVLSEQVPLRISAGIQAMASAARHPRR